MMGRRKGNQEQVWVSKEFKNELEKLQAEKLLNGKKVGNLGELTKCIVIVPSFADVKKEVLEIDDVTNLGIRMDRKSRRTLW